MNKKLLFHQRLHSILLLIICVCILFGTVHIVKSTAKMADSMQTMAQKVDDVNVNNINEILQKTEKLANTLDRISNIFN